MIEREKIIEALKRCENEWHKEEFDLMARAHFSYIEYIKLADALIAAGIRDITREGYICMNGEVIVPTPNIYNKVADLLACPRIKEREIEEEKNGKA